MDEQQVIAMLKGLPLSITITSREGKYRWECYAERGSASTFLEALRSALRSLQVLILEAPPPIDTHEPVLTTSEDLYSCGECRRPMPMSHFPHQYQVWRKMLRALYKRIEGHPESEASKGSDAGRTNDIDSARRTR